MQITTDALTEILAEQHRSSTELGRNLTVVICDAQGREVLLHRSNGASWITGRVAATKARTAVTFQMSSADFDAFRERSPEVVAVAAADLGFTPTGLAGGIPVRADGAVIGAVAVSGATAEQDAAVAARLVAILQPEH